MKWSLLLLLVAALGASAETCELPASPIQLQPVAALDGQRLILPGQSRLQVSLGSEAVTFAVVPNMLMIRYADGAVLSYRQLQEEELRSSSLSDLPLADFVRLVFGDDQGAATAGDVEEAKAVWRSILHGCESVRHYQRDGTDVYAYSQVRVDGEQYDAFYVLDEDRVHYIDVIKGRDLAAQILSTLSRRNAP